MVSETVKPEAYMVQLLEEIRDLLKLLHEDNLQKMELFKLAFVSEPGDEPLAVTIDTVRQKVPRGLKTKLTYEQTDDYVIVRPRRYLGREDFSKVAQIVREMGGEYVSAGKDSHFKVPRK